MGPPPPPDPGPLWSSSHQDQDGKPKRPSIHDNGDGTYRVSYIPDRTGRYTIVVKYGGDDIPASPYRVRATASGDASKCTVSGALSVEIPNTLLFKSFTGVPDSFLQLAPF